jgi:hypothetical protein
LSSIERLSTIQPEVRLLSLGVLTTGACKVIFRVAFVSVQLGLGEGRAKAKEELKWNYKGKQGSGENVRTHGRWRWRFQHWPAVWAPVVEEAVVRSRQTIPYPRFLASHLIM